MARANAIVQSELNADIGEVSFTVAGVGRLAVYVDLLSEANRRYGLLHGIKQRVADAAAIESIDQGPGKPPIKPTPAQRFAAMKVIVDHLNSGAEGWSTRAERADGEGSLLFKALVRAGADADKARAKIRELSRIQQLAVMNDPKIKPHVDAIRAELGRTIDTSGLLEGLID